LTTTYTSPASVCGDTDATASKMALQPTGFAIAP